MPIKATGGGLQDSQQDEQDVDPDMSGWIAGIPREGPDANTPVFAKNIWRKLSYRLALHHLIGFASRANRAAVSLLPTPSFSSLHPSERRSDRGHHGHWSTGRVNNLLPGAARSPAAYSRLKHRSFTSQPRCQPISRYTAVQHADTSHPPDSSRIAERAALSCNGEGECDHQTRVEEAYI